MEVEYKTTEQEITSIARRYLKERYTPDEDGEKLCICEDHMPIAIALRILDRLESIEKLLQPIETQPDAVQWNSALLKIFNKGDK